MTEDVGYYPQIDTVDPEMGKKFVSDLKEKYSGDELVSNLDLAKDWKVLVIGDIIIDEYCFTIVKGRAMKDPMLSVGYIDSEKYAGGILAIANHVSSYVKDVTVLTLIGDHDDEKGFIEGSVRENVKLDLFVKKNSPTNLKKRYLSKQRNEKLFKVEHMNDHPVSDELQKKIISYIEKNAGKYDMVIVGDFGHGFIDEGIVDSIEKNSKYLAVNVQTNGANIGFNYVTKYNSPDFISMDLREVQYAVQDRFSEYHVLIEKLNNLAKFNKYIITFGRKGCIMYDAGKIYHAPIFDTETKDTVGAGDALFSITSLLSKAEVSPELIPFYANCVGGIAVKIMGNKESVTKDKLIQFISRL
ncbi:hypothetical protein H6503_00990 [Candidatus Woesearchaeota archaeon]|nr:hypothetical protein [Candidatus Woesearchaeota archaeon]